MSFEGLTFGRCALFKEGYCNFLAGMPYAVVARNELYFSLIALKLGLPAATRNLHYLSCAAWRELQQTGKAVVAELPALEKLNWSDDALDKYDRRHRTTRKETLRARRDRRLRSIDDLVQARFTILSSSDPEAECNRIARAAGLNVSRAREMFFLLAAYGFRPNALLSPQPKVERRAESSPAAHCAKRGRKVKDPATTPVGWPFDQDTWPKLLRDGWKKHSRLGRAFMDVYLTILRTEFRCTVQGHGLGARIHPPAGGAFPTYTQFAYFIKKRIGKLEWQASKFGHQTLRNKSRVSSAPSATSRVANLLQECQWDAQYLDELPADLRDPTKPGKRLIRVQVWDLASKGPVGLGYDYDGESVRGYLMALLSMITDKRAFCELFGVTIAPGAWAARGAALRILGDRGPAIATPIREVIAEVLQLAQAWAASYDPKGKASVEAGHHKRIHVEGPPRTPSRFRSVGEIMRDDIRATVSTFETADRCDSLDFDQARRGVVGTPAGIWADLMSQGLYAGRHYEFEEVARHTMQKMPVSITRQGVMLGGLRYLSSELTTSGLLERAVGQAYEAEAFGLPLTVKRIWLDHEGSLMPLEAVPVRFSAFEASHVLSYEEALLYAELQAGARRAREEPARAARMADAAEREKDAAHQNEILRATGLEPSKRRAHTTKQHREVFRTRANAR